MAKSPKKKYKLIKEQKKIKKDRKKTKKISCTCMLMATRLSNWNARMDKGTEIRSLKPTKKTTEFAMRKRPSNCMEG